MAEVTKYQLIPNTTTTNNIVSDFKTNLSVLKTKFKSTTSLVFCILLFVVFAFFFANAPGSPTSSPAFTDGSRFASVYSYFFPNSTDQGTGSLNDGASGVPLSGSLPDSRVPPDRGEDSPRSGSTGMDQGGNGTAPVAPISPVSRNDTVVKAEEQMDQSSTVSPPVPKNSTAEMNQSSTVSPSVPKNNTVVQAEKQMNHSSTVSPPVVNNSTVVQSELQMNQSSTVSPSVAKNDTVVQSEKQMNQSSTVTPPMPKKVSPLVPKNYTVTQSEKPMNQSGSTVSSQSPPVAKTDTIVQQGSPNSKVGSSNSSKNGSGTDYSTLFKKQGSGHANGTVSKQGNDDFESLVASLVGCDLYDGEWVRDESYPLYKPGSCKIVDEQFNCALNGRPDTDYQKLKWKPKGCTLPRLSEGHMLELLRGKRLVFVGDSLNRNMWESLVCNLENSVKNKKNVYEAYGRHSFRTEASYSFVFKDYNFTVEFFVSPFLVQQWEVQGKDGATTETLRLDLMVRDAHEFKNADFLVFNTGHWWTHDKTSKGEDYYQEGSHVYKQLDVNEAFRKAMTTWGRWVDANINPQRTHVLFRSYSPSHFSGGQWNAGGKCDGETEPIRNDAYLTPELWKNTVAQSVIKGMKTPVSYLNITRLTDYRKDGHPSVYRKQHVSGDEKKSPLKYQDCSHWCLPGVPDSWNELLFAELLRKR